MLTVIGQTVNAQRCLSVRSRFRVYLFNEFTHTSAHTVMHKPQFGTCGPLGRAHSLYSDTEKRAQSFGQDENLNYGIYLAPIYFLIFRMQYQQYLNACNVCISLQCVCMRIFGLDDHFQMGLRTLNSGL